MCAKKFLSTPSARRATIISSIIVLPLSISIHALREEGDIVHGIGESLSFISIHALREEGDHRRLPVWLVLCHFYPRPPRGGRRALASATLDASIFLSTPSARRATSGSARSSKACQFLSTPSARRATDRLLYPHQRRAISIHALREEGDL